MSLRPHPAAPSGITNGEDPVEMARLANKARLVATAVGGLFPGLADCDLAGVHEVLDCACGPGGWTLEVAQAYQHMRVTGIDSSKIMVEYAHARAKEEGLLNATHLEVLSLAGPFSFFPDDSFDLISAHFLSKYLRKKDWPLFLGECRRLLRPGGRIRLTDYEPGLSNAPAHEELIALFLRAMRLTGHSFSPTDRHLGLLCELEPMLFGAGFEHCTYLGHWINYSYGTPGHEEWKRDFLILSKLALPFLVRMNVAPETQINELYQRQQQEMNLPGFHALLPLLTVWGVNA